MEKVFSFSLHGPVISIIFCSSEQEICVSDEGPNEKYFVFQLFFFKLLIKKIV